MFHCPRLAPAFLLSTLVSVSLIQLTGCSSSSKSAGSSTTGAISMSPLTPAKSTLQAGTQEQFAVTVTGATDTSITWDILDANGQSHYSGDSTVGTISASGLYQAPAATTTLTLTLYAGATANTSISRTAALTINPLPQSVSISITPTSATASTCPTQPCGPDSSVSFSAVVSHASDTSVIWQVGGIPGGNPTVGLISDQGVYTAPVDVPSPATVAVTAVANADPTKKASAAVVISEAGGLSVSLNQSTVNLTAGGSFNFTASVSPSSTPDPAVTWSRTCGVADCGTITTTGVDSATYVAPSTVTSTLQVTITATLDIDTTKSASAGVAVASPASPTMTITISPTSSILADGTATLAATFTGLPGDSPAPTITWPAAGTPLFCVSTDEEVPADDNCSDSDGDDLPGQVDGPGSISPTAPTTVTTATYTAPDIVWGESAYFAPGFTAYCSQATAATASTAAWVYVPVTATTTVNGTPTTLTANICIPLVPNN